MEFSDLNSKEQEFIGHLRRHQGEPLDLDKSAVSMRMTVSRLERLIYRLIAAKMISRRIKGGQQFLEVGPPPEPKRVYRDACPRCAVVNCTEHTASYLTNGRVRPGSPMRI